MNRKFFVLFLIVATELIGFGLIIPVLPQLAQRFETNGLLLGILLASYSFAQFLAAPILGVLSDKYGRRPILILSKLGSVAGYVLLAFSQSYVLFLMARLLDGFTGGNITVARAYVADITTEENRTKGMAVIGMSFGLGFLLGPALGGLLYDGTGQFKAALVAGALSFIAFLFTVFFLDEPEKRSQSVSHFSVLKQMRRVFSLPMMALLCVVYGVYMILFSGFETTFSVFTGHLLAFTEKQNSYLFVYIGLVGFLVQGTLMRRAKAARKWHVVLGLSVASFGFMILGLSVNLVMVLVAISVLSIGIGLVNVYLPSLVSMQADTHNRGLVMGVYESIGSLSRIIGPILAYLSIYGMLMEGYVFYAFVMFTLGIILALAYASKHGKA